MQCLHHFHLIKLYESYPNQLKIYMFVQYNLLKYYCFVLLIRKYIKIYFLSLGMERHEKDIYIYVYIYLLIVMLYPDDILNATQSLH